MKLSDLDPQWFAEPGRHGQGIVFRCPHCRDRFICVTFARPLDGGPAWDIGNERARPIRRLWEILYGDLQDPEVKGAVLPKGTAVVPPGFLWHRTGDTFDSLTLSPSVDASRAGCWHGFVQNGEIR